MKLKDAIEYVDEMRPNAFTTKVKVKWLAELDGHLAAEIFHMAPLELRQFRYTEADLEVELLVDEPHDDIYTAWLCAKIDEANGEYSKYQNSMQTYNENYGSFLRWFGRLYDPAEGYASEEVRAQNGCL